MSLTPREVLVFARRDGLTLQMTDDGGLRITPKDLISPRRLKQLKEHKQEIIHELFDEYEESEGWYGEPIDDPALYDEMPDAPWNAKEGEPNKLDVWDWIEWALEKGYRLISSYELKDEFERFSRACGHHVYISNGAMKGAMRTAGYKPAREDECNEYYLLARPREGGPNA
jgi:hypothetical protein